MVRVSAEMAQNPARLNNFRIQVEVPPVISDQHREGIVEVVRHCLIHNTLLNPASITLVVETSALHAA